MRDKQTIRSFLGVTQEDLAMLLGVSRAQVSMYESRRRNLPPRAMQLLSEMLVYVQSVAAGADKQIIAPEHHDTKESLERRLRVNEYRQAMLARKIAATAKKVEARSRLSILNEFLESRKDGKHIAGKILPRSAFTENSTSLTGLLQEQLYRQELLAIEKQLLETRLKE